eukprot:m.28171 g.28171  ORF g.28171 m.28171 type:complete len:702 (+) comp4491_c0_seq1:82-2187(+)
MSATNQPGTVDNVAAYPCVIDVWPAAGHTVRQSILPPVSVVRATFQDAVLATYGHAHGWPQVPEAPDLDVTLPLLNGASASFVAQVRHGSVTAHHTRHLARTLEHGRLYKEGTLIVHSDRPSWLDVSHATRTSATTTTTVDMALQAVAPLPSEFHELALVLWTACHDNSLCNAATTPRETSPSATPPAFLFGAGPRASVLLTGPSGSGKTTAVHAIAGAVGATVVPFIRPPTANSDAAKALDACFHRAAGEQPSIIVIDDAHVMFPSTNQSNDRDTMAQPFALHFVRRVERLSVEQRTAVVVIAQGDVGSIDADVAASLLDHISVPLPDQTTIHAILQDLFHNTASWDTTVDLKAVAERCRGRSLSDVSALSSFAVRFARDEHASSMSTLHGLDTHHDLLTVSNTAVEAALTCLEASAGSGTQAVAQVATPTQGWSRLVGMSHFKDKLDAVLVRVCRADSTVLRALHLRWPKGVLIYGAPGVGKTTAARAATAEAGLATVELTLGKLARGEVGESERAVAQAFKEAARFRPCAVLIDDIDVVFGRRALASGGGGGIGTGVVSQLLIEMDQATEGVVVMATSSSPDRVDPALLQAGRIDHCVYMPPPDVDTRALILRHACAHFDTRDDLAWDTLATLCDGFTPADLQVVVRKAAYAALSEAHTVGSSRLAITGDMLRQCIDTTTGCALDSHDALHTPAPQLF